MSPDASAAATLHAFTRRFRHVPGPMRKTLTYDQGREMTHHARLARRLRIDVFFADPHSPWQRGINENTFGFIREYLPKGADLSRYSQGYLNAIARSLKLHFKLETKLIRSAYCLDNSWGSIEFQVGCRACRLIAVKSSLPAIRKITVRMVDRRVKPRALRLGF